MCLNSMCIFERKLQLVINISGGMELSAKMLANYVFPKKNVVNREPIMINIIL